MRSTIQPHFFPTLVSLSLTLYNITCVRSTTQPNKCQKKIGTPFGWTQTQPFNHKYRSQLQSLSHSLSTFTLEISTSQPYYFQTWVSLSLTVRYHLHEINHSTTFFLNSSLSLSPTHSVHLISLVWDQPLNQINVKIKIGTPVGFTQTQPFNHKYGTQLLSLSHLLSLFTLAISTSQPHCRSVSLPHNQISLAWDQPLNH